MSECGCRVLWDSTGDAKYVVDNCQIERCPMHEAAERMLEALETTKARLGGAGYDVGRELDEQRDGGKALSDRLLDALQGIEDAQEAVSTAIRAAKGEADER